MCEYCGCQSVSIIADLTAEHDVVVDLLGEAQRAAERQDVDRAADLAARILAILTPHSAVEERGVFPALADDFPDHVAQLTAEHAAIEAVLAEPAADPAGFDRLGWPQRLVEAAEVLRAHILKEQDGVFPAALATLDADDWAQAVAVRRRVGSGLTANAAI
ncbi:MAG: hemerythrin domain-containing protein [Actinomycetales bacterium]